MPPPELAVLFIDMDAYFASCEQMDRPELRERPIAVTPVMAATGCCIACSYEARPYGVRTGCSVRDALRLCPKIEIVQARPDFYIETHHALQRAIDTVIPVTEVESIDECRCHLMANERHPDTVTDLALGIKHAIFQSVGPMTCSIGAAPNRLLAKIAADLGKPDGLTLLPRSSLPGPLANLPLTELPGINRGIRRRLRTAGIRDVADLYARSEPQLRDAWGSVLGA